MDKGRFTKLFVYGSLLPGEAHHSAMEGCSSLGAAQTAAGYRLVELQQYPCMVTSGARRVHGELYQVSRDKLMELDRLKEHGSLFHRQTIALASGEEAQAYLMHEDQVRGRRRLHVDAWKDRFKPRSARIL